MRTGFDSLRRLLVDPQAHRGFTNSEPFTSDSFERTFERTYKHSYQLNYESNVSSGKTIGTLSSTTDQFIISNENSLEPKQNEMQFPEDVSAGKSWKITETKK